MGVGKPQLHAKFEIVLSGTLNNQRTLIVCSVVLKPQPTFPGDNGRAVNVPKEKEAESKELFKINQFNLMASDMMSLNRTLPDYRMDAYV